MSELPPGVLADVDMLDVPTLYSDEYREWLDFVLPYTMFGSDVVERHAAPFDAHKPPHGTGLYFLVWRDLICYVGQAVDIAARLQQYAFREGRPIDRVATIIGLPKWSLTEFEHAYIRRFDPPWNAENKRCGGLDRLPSLLKASAALDTSKVMPDHAPLVSGEAIFWPHWRQRVLGRLQFEEREG